MYLYKKKNDFNSKACKSNKKMREEEKNRP